MKGILKALFGIGKDKDDETDELKGNINEPDSDYEDEEEDEEINSFISETHFKDLNERELLRLLIIMHYNQDYYSITDSWSEVFKLIRDNKQDKEVKE